MKNIRLLSFLFLLATQPFAALAQQPSKPVYMHIFFHGTQLRTNRAVLHYSPAFKSKTAEFVAEPTASKWVSPGNSVSPATTSTTTENSGQITVTDKGAFVRGSNGKMRPQTEDDL